MGTEVTAEKLYEAIRYLQRPTYGSGRASYDEELRQVVGELLRTPQVGEQEPIRLAGWRLDEEFHGGYPSTSGEREILGSGFLIFSGTAARKAMQRPNCTITESVVVQVWRQEGHVLAVALEESAESGYVGIDNHHGTDTTWRVIGLRVLDLPAAESPAAS